MLLHNLLAVGNYTWCRICNETCIIFFWKHPGALGSHLKILGAHVDRTKRRRGCPSSLETRHTEVLTPHTHTLTLAPVIPRRVTLERGIGGLHTWSAHHQSYGSVPWNLYYTCSALRWRTNIWLCKTMLLLSRGTPSPRSEHAAACFAERYLLIFGGGSHSTCFSDLHVLDTQTVRIDSFL